MKNKFYKLIPCILVALLCVGCKGSSTPSKADMSGYDNFNDQDHVFVVSDVKDFASHLDQKETFVTYFGFNTCPWCNAAMPILNDTAKELNQTIYYINTRPNNSVTNNTEIPDYDLLVEKIGDIFELDTDGKPHLYVPFVIYVKNGEVVYYHEGTLEEHDANETTLSEEEINELKEIYKEGFNLIKS